MANRLVRDLVQEWIHILPPAYSPVVTADNVAATARGTFLGQDTSDPDAQGVAIYKETQNLPTAIASLLNHSQLRANFHPASTTPDKLAAAFEAYVTEIDANPFFHLETNETDKQKFYSRDYNLLIDQVVNLYKGVSTQDLNELKTAITDMAKSVFGQERSEQWKNVFSQSSINLSDLQNPKFYLYYTSLHMFHEKTGKSEVNEQDYEVRATTYLILPDLIRAQAERLAGLDRKSVDDWLSGATSPEAKNAQLCFTPTPLVRRR
ncbi:MAG TPA: hypothetical protein VGR45_10930 [Stellaceae bacterium]|nr:hypothetical protein [Stellaceae bacterium]